MQTARDSVFRRLGYAPETLTSRRKSENEIVADINNYLKHIGSQVSLFLFVHHSEITSVSDFFLADGVHLNSAGNLILSKDFRRTINEIPDPRSIEIQDESCDVEFFTFLKILPTD